MRIAQWPLAGAVFMLGLVALSAAPAVEPVAWSPHGADRGILMNMGPTGARAWMRAHRFQIVTVDAGSPADGVLMPGDLVLGAGGTTFSMDGDSRMILGDAIGRAEAEDGALALTIRRDGRRRRVTVPLPVTGSFADSWPYACAKSQRILDEACVYLRARQMPNGDVPTDGGMGAYTAGLLFLASGDARFMDAGRRAVYATSDMKLETMSYSNWPLGYGGLLLAEYYLLTGDVTVLDRLQAVCDALASGQMRCGSWGHDGPAGGYGAMNQAGIVDAMTLCLAQECGLAVDQEALNRALTFFGRYAALGAVPYGDHPPRSNWPDDNGKNASAAVLCGLHPAWQPAAAMFAGSVGMSYWLRETGHTGGFFSMVWGPLAADMAGAEAFRTFMDYQDWFYTLCRTWEGALVLLPYKEALTRFDSSSYIWFGGDFTTGGMGLAFALPHRKLRILGAPRSVFGAAIDGALLDARTAYQARDWPAFDAAVAAAQAEIVAGTEDAHRLAQLQSAAAMAQASTRLTIKEIENNLDEGDPYRAEQQFRALKRFLGADTAATRALDERFEDGAVKWHAGAGKRFYEALREMRGVAVMSWLPYGEIAKSHMGDIQSLRPRMWEVLLPKAGEAFLEMLDEADGGFVTATRAFTLDATAFSALRLQLRSPRNAHTQVWLNGERVADIMRGQRYDYAEIELDARAAALLRMGANELTIRGASAGAGRNALDVALEGAPSTTSATTPPRTDPRQAPVLRLPEALRAALTQVRETFLDMPIDAQPTAAIPEPVLVEESMNRFRAALERACDGIGTNAILELLRSPVPYVRHLGASSLARRGEVGLRLAAKGLRSEDWRVRSACCDAVAAMGDAVNEAGGATVVPADLLRDDHAWVRYRAAKAVGDIGITNAATLKGLAQAVVDDDVWVRAAAVSAIGKTAADPHILHAAARDALMVPSTSFQVVGRALRLIEKSGEADKDLIPSLLFVLEHPGEGMGSQRLNGVMELLVELDPEGTHAVPALATVAAGGYAYDRLRGNPRKTAIEWLGKLGANAEAAIPVLEAIACASEDAETLQAAARAALEQIAKQ